METHLDESLGLSREFSRKGENKICSISSFVFLLFSGLSDHFSGGMVHIRLFDNCRSVRGDKQLFQVVNDHLVHA